MDGHRTAHAGGLVLPLVSATFLMGSSFVAGKILLTDGFAPLPLVAWRFVVASLGTLALVLLRGGRPGDVLDLRPLGLRGAATLAAIGLLQTAGVMSLLFLAMRSVPAGTAAVLLFTNPIWVAVLGRVFLRERMHAGAVAGLVLGVAGTALAIGVPAAGGADGPSGMGAVQGELIGLAAALCWSCSTILHKRARLPVGAWKLSFWQMLVGAFAVFALAAASGEHWPERTSAAQWGWFLWLALPASTGSFGLWYVALERGGAVRTSSFLFLAPLFAVLLAWLVLGNSLGLLQALGALLIGLALWLVNR
jgi:drug/metabolite transporter (DMT)-like permease